MATNKQHYHIPLTSSDTSQPMAPGQHSSVLYIGIQVVQLSQEYSVTPSGRFIPPAPPRRATNRNKVSNQSKCLNESPEWIHSMCLTWIVWNHFYIVGLEYLNSSETIEEVSVRDEPIAPTRSQHFNSGELTSWNEDTCHQLQGHSPGDNRKRRVHMLAYMRNIMSQESWDVLLTSAQRQDSSRSSKGSLA
jgi:hypothetical protein